MNEEFVLNEKGYIGNGKPIKYKIINDCWIWINSKGKTSNYPRLTRNGNLKMRLNRYVYLLYNGDIPEGKVVRHKCDNPKCINPNHLIIGTQADNMRDKVERGRSNKGKKFSNEHINKISKSLKGRKLTNEQINKIALSNTGKKRSKESRENISKGHWKLTEKQVLEIKQEILNSYFNNEKQILSNKIISEKFNIHPDTVKNIRRGKSTYTKFLGGGLNDWLVKKSISEKEEM